MATLYLIGIIILILLFFKKLLDYFAQKPIKFLVGLINLFLLPYLTYLITHNEIYSGIVIGVLAFIYIIIIFELY